MGVSVEQWRAAIGSYNAGKSCYFASSSSCSSSRVPILLQNPFLLMCLVATTSLQSMMNALMLLILLSGDVERNPGPNIMDHKPTMHELTDFPGKARHFNIAVEIGMRYHVVGTDLLNGESDIVSTIESKHECNAEQINMDILSCWVQGEGIVDRTWRGLLGVLRVRCTGLAQDIEETLRAKNDASKVVFEPLDIVPTTMPATALHFSQPSLDECFHNAGIPVDDVILDETITRIDHIAVIARKITQWRDLCPFLGIEESEKEVIETASELNEQRRKLLNIWKQKNGRRATYRYLCTILWNQSRLDLIEAVCEVMKSNVEPSTHQREQAATPEMAPPSAKRRYLTPHKSELEDVQMPRQLEYCSHERDIIGQVERFNDRFIDLEIRLRRELTRSQVCVDDVRDSITLLPTSIRTEHYQFIKDCSDDIENAGSIKDLFRHLNLYWTYLEYSLMGYIIKRHSTMLSNELKDDMRVYTNDMETFKKRTTVEQLLQVGLGCIIKEPPPGFSRLTMKLRREMSDFTLEELDAVRRRTSIEFNLPTFALMLASVEKSSLCIKWHIPSSEVHRFEATIFPAVLSRISADLFYLKADISTLSSSYTGIFVSPGMKIFEKRFCDLEFRLQNELEISTKCLKMFRHSNRKLPMAVRFDHYQFVTEHLKNINKAEDIDEFIGYLDLYWTYLEYSLLIYIIECHSDTEDLKKDMRKYEEDIEDFKAHTTVEQLRQAKGIWSTKRMPPPKFSRIVTELHGKAANYTLKELDQFRRKVCFEFNLPTFIMMLESIIKDGCLCIKWCIPSSEVYHFAAEFVTSSALKHISDDLFKLSVDLSTLSSEHIGTGISADPSSPFSSVLLLKPHAQPPISPPLRKVDSSPVSFLSHDDMPTLPLLVSFPAMVGPLNIPQELSQSYFKLGMVLLQDTNGIRMAILEAEHGDDAVRINLAILREWLEGGGLRPVTWATFTNVMADIRQGAMAKEISEILKLTGIFVSGMKNFEKRFFDLEFRLQNELEISTKCLKMFRHSNRKLPMAVQSDHYQFVTKHLKNIDEAEDVDEVIGYLDLYWTYLEYSLLSYIIECHSDTEDLKKDMRKYEEDIEDFKAHTTVEQLRQAKGIWSTKRVPPPNFSRIVTELHGKAANYTLKELDQFRRKVCFEFNLPTFIMMLESIIKDGCLCIKWYIPSSEVHHFAAKFVTSSALKRISDDLFKLDVDFMSSEHIGTGISDDPSSPFSSVPLIKPHSQPAISPPLPKVDSSPFLSVSVEILGTGISADPSSPFSSVPLHKPHAQPANSPPLLKIASSPFLSGSVHSLVNMPTLPLLDSFPAKAGPLSIPRELSSSYFKLGIVLLQDISGIRMAVLEAEHGGSGVYINQAILQEWLEGGGLRPVTWATLTKVMADIRQGALAKEISEIIEHMEKLQLQQLSHEIKKIKGEIQEIQGETHHRQKKLRGLKEEDYAYDTQHDLLKRQVQDLEQECGKFYHLSSKDRMKAVNDTVDRSSKIRKRMQIIGNRIEALIQREEEVKSILDELEKKAIKSKDLSYRLAKHIQELLHCPGKHTHWAIEWNECKVEFDSCNEILTRTQQELRDITMELRHIQQHCRDQFRSCRKRLCECKESVECSQHDLIMYMQILKETINVLNVAKGALARGVVGAAAAAAVGGLVIGATAAGIGALIVGPLALVHGAKVAYDGESKKREQNKEEVDRCERELARCDDAMLECRKILGKCDWYIKELLQILDR